MNLRTDIRAEKRFLTGSKHSSRRRYRDREPNESGSTGIAKDVRILHESETQYGRLVYRNREVRDLVRDDQR